MSDMTVASTTDTQAEINKAAGVTEKPEPQEVQTDEGGLETPQPDDSKGQEKRAEGLNEPEHKTKSGFQKRIDRLTRERHADQQAIQELRARLASIESGAKPQEPEQVAPSIVEADPEPKESDFTDFKEFTKALARWTFRQEQKDHDLKASQQAAEQKEANERKTEYDAHLARLDEARERYEDFDEIADRVGRSGQFQLPAATGPALIAADNSGDIIYFLMKHPEKCKELQGMSDARAVMEIGRISAALEPRESAEDEEPVAVGQPAPPRKRASQAPAPIRPVGGSATRSTVPLDELSYQDYKRIRAQQEKARYR